MFPRFLFFARYARVRVDVFAGRRTPRVRGRRRAPRRGAVPVRSSKSDGESQLLLKKRTNFFVKGHRNGKMLLPRRDQFSLSVTLSIPHPNSIISHLLDLFDIFSPDVSQLGLAISL